MLSWKMGAGLDRSGDTASWLATTGSLASWAGKELAVVADLARRLVIAVVLLVLPAAACSPAAAQQARLGERFTLAVGQAAQLAGEDLWVGFQEVLEDSRCPQDVTCVWAGRASVALEIRDRDGGYRMVLTQPGLTDEPSVETYKLYRMSYSLRPYPQSGKKIETGDYRLEMTVSK